MRRPQNSDAVRNGEVGRVQDVFEFTVLLRGYQHFRIWSGDEYLSVLAEKFFDQKNDRVFRVSVDLYAQDIGFHAKGKLSIKVCVADPGVSSLLYRLILYTGNSTGWEF